VDVETGLGCIHQPILRQLMIGDGNTTIEWRDRPLPVRSGAYGRDLAHLRLAFSRRASERARF
jgi:hypothetical protein